MCLLIIQNTIKHWIQVLLNECSVQHKMQKQYFILDQENKTMYKWMVACSIFCFSWNLLKLNVVHFRYSVSNQGSARVWKMASVWVEARLGLCCEKVRTRVNLWWIAIFLFSLGKHKTIYTMILFTFKTNEIALC